MQHASHVEDVSGRPQVSLRGMNNCSVSLKSDRCVRVGPRGRMRCLTWNTVLVHINSPRETLRHQAIELEETHFPALPAYVVSTFPYMSFEKLENIFMLLRG